MNEPKVVYFIKKPAFSPVQQINNIYFYLVDCVYCTMYTVYITIKSVSLNWLLGQKVAV